MLTRLICTTAIALAATAGPALAEPMSWDGPYFTYSPGARDFEDIEWTPLEFAAFSAYGGYFANIRRPRADTPLPELFVESKDFGIEDELSLVMKTSPVPTFMPYATNFSAFSTAIEVEETDQVPVPEPSLLALVGAGLLVGSRALRRRFRASSLS